MTSGAWACFNIFFFEDASATVPHHMQLFYTHVQRCVAHKRMEQRRFSHTHICRSPPTLSYGDIFYSSDVRGRKALPYIPPRSPWLI